MDTDLPYREAELYAQEYESPIYRGDMLKDKVFWKKVAEQQPSSVLELACGYGRILSTFKEHGSLKVVGLDSSLSMLEMGRERYPDIQFVKGDMRCFDLDSKFELIFFAFNSFLHLLTYEDLASCFQSIQSHLAVKIHHLSKHGITASKNLIW
ncbi:MAG: class I SAM-dependent methyltransferase [Oscillatoriales cyanobacterium]|nr:MAG: class I SAM-dependent methyltransferase [Oscillatoriales cyanobacterium]